MTGTAFFELNAGTVTMSNLSSITELSAIMVETGGNLSFSNVTSYTVPVGMNVQWTAQHPGSILNFPNLVSIAGPTAAITYLSVTAQHQDNGTVTTVSFPTITTITKDDDGDLSANSVVSFNANNGTISAPLLATFHDNDSHPNSSLNATSGGTLALPKLTDPVGINSINTNAQSHPELFSTLTETASFELNAGTVVMSN